SREWERRIKFYDLYALRVFRAFRDSILIICKCGDGIDLTVNAVCPRTSRAPHAVAAVEAAVAGAAADGECPAVVAGRRVALEVGELAVLLAEALVHAQRAGGGVRLRRLGGVGGWGGGDRWSPSPPRRARGRRSSRCGGR